MNNRKIMLVDGHSLMNRAFYGLAGRQNLTAADGTPTGAVFAFLNMLLSYSENLEPDLIVTAFDHSGPTFRHEMFTEYKAGRKAMPEDLSLQIPLAKEMLDYLGIPRWELAGYEADDLIGTLAKKAKGQGFEVTIVSGDKDLFQLIDEKIKVLLPVTRGGSTVQESMDLLALQEKYGLEPWQIIDLKALMGDASDGIPGIRGIGEKTALKLLHDYKDLKTVLNQADSIKGAVGKKIQEGQEMARLSFDLAKIDSDAPLTGFTEDLTSLKNAADKKSLLDFFLRLGFKSMIEKFSLTEELEKHQLAELKKNAAVLGRKSSYTDVAEFLRATKDQELVLFWQEERDNVISYISREGEFIHLGSKKGLELFGKIASPDLIIWDYKAFLRHYKLPAQDNSPFDLRIAAYLVNQLEGQTDLDHALSRILASDYRQLPTDLAGSGRQMDLLTETAGQDSLQEGLLAEDEEDIRLFKAWNMFMAQEKQKALAEEMKLTDLLLLEFSLAGVLADMEARGIDIDQKELSHQKEEMLEDIKALESKIYALAGYELNLNSPRQLGQLLFDDLKLPAGKKTKSGHYSTAAEELEAIRYSHEIVELIIEHRSLMKLKSTFLDGLSSALEEDGRIRTSYHQTLTATGRLSSSDPNLQNIPIRTKRGREIRKIFRAAPGYLLLDADYSQIELRLLAHLSQDPKLLQAFREGLDVHKATASSLFEIPIAEVNAEQRAAAKTVNFSIVYGISDFGLARDLGIPMQKAHDYIAAYDREYSKVRAWLKDTIKQAHKTGYVETIMGRRRYLTELKSSNLNIRRFGERAAANAPVQGTAADLIKIAMVNIAAAFKKRKLDAYLVLQVHDELLVEASRQDAQEAAKILQEEMTGAMKLSLPLLAEVATVESWGDVRD